MAKTRRKCEIPCENKYNEVCRWMGKAPGFLSTRKVRNEDSQWNVYYESEVIATVVDCCCAGSAKHQTALRIRDGFVFRSPIRQALDQARLEEMRQNVL